MSDPVKRKADFAALLVTVRNSSSPAVGYIQFQEGIAAMLRDTQGDKEEVLAISRDLSNNARDMRTQGLLPGQTRDDAGNVLNPDGSAADTRILQTGQTRGPDGVIRNLDGTVANPGSAVLQSNLNGPNRNLDGSNSTGVTGAVRNLDGSAANQKQGMGTGVGLKAGQTRDANGVVHNADGSVVA